MTDDQVFSFARNTIRSVWALELLLLLHKDRTRAWSANDLIRELRSSEAVIVPCLGALKAAGLIDEPGAGQFAFAPVNEELENMTAELSKIYAARPIALAKAIMRAPNEKLSIFADAFKFKNDK